MNRKLLILGLLFICGVVAWSGTGSLSWHGFKSVSLTTSNSGDTAKVIRVSQFTGRDSFDYIDSIAVVTDEGPDSSESLIKFTSPLQVSRITLQTITARPTAIDTTIVYSCSLDLGTNKFGFAWAAPETEADTLLSTAIAVLVDSINNTTAMEDSVLAEDSSTYVKLISKFAMDNLEGAARWTLDLGDSLTEGQRDSCDIEMVVDSMVAKINADSIGGYVTAANLTDTAYTVTSDVKGRMFTVKFADTAQDTTIQVANKTSWSSTTDTISLNKLTYPEHTYRGMYAKFKILPSAVTTAGLGLVDSGLLRLTSDFIGIHKNLANDSLAALPCSLVIKLPPTLAADTIFLENVHLVYTIKDSLTETAITAAYRILIDYVLTER
ncbi:hypothetical protein KAR91_27390 [Candidatus Pacearchaeota archaeon]|nr:hypothetical protein [Candidatus Pacearchaeota archaeon]